MKKLLHHGAAILFAIAVIVFVSTFAYQLWIVGDVANGLQAGTYSGSKPGWLTILASLSGALGSAALPFFGACIVDRLDRHWETRK